MDKNRDKNVKKTVVRNVKQPLITTRRTDLNKSKRISFKKSTITQTQPPPPPPPTTASSLEQPELNSTLEIARQIDQIQQDLKIRKTKPPSSTQLTNEMITRKLNFPYEQHVYKDLVPLRTVSKVSTTHTVREPLPLKDKEPKLGDFVETRINNEYLYEPKRKVDNRKATNIAFNSLKLYKVLNLHNMT